MPGVVIRTGATSGPAASGHSPSGTFFVVGQAERGPTAEAARVSSMAEFIRLFGVSTSYSTLYDSLRTFFEEGGSRAYVLRVVGPAATTGALAAPLQDRAVSPAATLGVAATSAGAWSSRVSVKVLDGSAANSFRIQVMLDGDVVEDYANLSSPAQAVSVVNAGPRASAYIRLTDSASASVAPTNNPKVTASPVVLAAGTDDRAAVNATVLGAALDKFPAGLGDGAVAIPGMGASVHAALIAHAEALNRIALLCEASNATVSSLLSTAAGLDSPRAALFAPWIRVPDAYGSVKTISPEPYIAACRARAHDMTGPWRAGAGEISKARFVVAPDQTYTPAQALSLDDGKVNAIVSIASSVRNYGWRSLSEDPANWYFLSSADLVNRVVVLATLLLEPYVFSPIDDRGHLLSAIAGTLEGIVKPIADLGGLFAFVEEDATGNLTELDPGYKVVVDQALNPRASMAANQVFAQLGLRPSPSAALVYLDVTKAAVTASL